MKIIKIIDQFKSIIYSVILMIVLSIGALFMFYPKLGIEKLHAGHVGIVLVSIAIISLFRCFKLKGKLIMAVLFVLMLIIQVVAGAHPWLQVSTLGCALIVYLFEQSRILRMLVCVGLLGTLVYSLFSDTYIPKIVVASISTFVLINTVELIECFWKKERTDSDFKRQIIWLWPVWILFFTLLFVSPSSSEPYDWKYVKHICNVVVENVSKIINLISANDEGFDINMAGFDENGEIGGNIASDDKNTLSVSSDYMLTSNLYLRGMYMTSFDGRSWSEPKNISVEDTRWDTFETYYAVLRYDRDNADKYFLGTILTMEYQDFMSHYYFSPLKMLSLKEKNKSGYYVTHNNEDFLTKKKNTGDIYATMYYQLNVPQSTVGDIIVSDNPDDEEAWKYTVSKFSEDQKDYYVYLDYRDNVKKEYSQEITLSDEMKAWVYAVTCGYASKYERVKAIEQELRSYAYDTSADKLPAYVNSPEKFLDYFVLEKQKGYCTFYATALTLLAWSEGLPARYVQGFSLPAVGKKADMVKSRNAHAWVEIYFEGYGWVTFEPTPGYEIGFSEWVIPDGIIYNPEKNDGGNTQEHKGDDEVDKQALIEAAKAAELAKKNRIKRAVLYSGFGLIGFVVLVAILDKLITGLLYKKKNITDKFKWEANKNFSILKKLGYELAPGETLEEFTSRIKSSQTEKGEPTPLFIPDYEAVIYGGREVTMDMILIARTDRRYLIKQLGFFARLTEWI